MRAHGVAGLAILAGVLVSAQPGIAEAADVTQLNAKDPMTWLVKSVCVDSQSQAIAADPYGSCPAGAGIRKLRVGDPIPYHNVEQLGYQQRDAFPVNNPLDGKTWVINTFDYIPFNYFNLYATTNAESDGYDVIAVQDGWASIVNTSDGGGYGTAFFGSSCRLGDGWVLFPASNFSATGSGKIAIKGVNWEQSDQSYPGACPTSYSTILKPRGNSSRTSNSAGSTVIPGRPWIPWCPIMVTRRV